MSLAALEGYIVASQDEARCWVWHRGPDRQFAQLPEEILGSERVIDVPALGVSIPVADIYRGIVEGEEGVRSR